MADLSNENPAGEQPLIPNGTNNKLRKCNELEKALESGSIGHIVSSHEALIVEYYQDVQKQATMSFWNATIIGAAGFFVLVLTLLYVLYADSVNSQKPKEAAGSSLATIATLGGVAGVVTEFIACVAFVLYARTARQFSAFHICLERTHRYLIAYTIASKLEKGRDETLRDLTCIMANAPTIARIDVDGSVREGRPAAISISQTPAS